MVGSDLAFKSFPNEFVIVFLITVSDLSATDITNANDVQADSWLLLLTYVTQLPAQQKLPQCMLVKDVCKRALEKMSARRGDRLFIFKAEGGLLPSGGLNWKNGSWQPEFEESNKGSLKSVTHGPTQLVFIPGPEYCSRIDKGYKLASNWLDDKSAFAIANIPPICVTKVLGKDCNFRPLIATQRAKNLANFAKEAHLEWELAQQKANAGNFKGDDLQGVAATTLQQA